MRGHAALIAGGLAVAGACAAVAASGDVGGAERAAFHAINDLPGALTPVLWVAQLSGVLIVPLLLAGVAATRRRWRLAAALALIAPTKLLLEHAVIKELVHRERPGTSICGGDATCASFRDVPLEGPSFVSGHAMITWAVAVVLWPHLRRRWRWVPVGVAVANGIARIHLGAHAPLDIVGGAGVGVALGAALTMAVAARGERRGLAAEPVGTTESNPTRRTNVNEQETTEERDVVRRAPDRTDAATRAADRRDATADTDAGRGPTPDEEAAADEARADLGDDEIERVGKATQEMAELGKDARGEGRIS